MNLRKLLIFSLFFLASFTVKAEPLVRIFDLQGESFVFYGPNQPYKQLKVGDYVRTGNIIATAPSSAVVLEIQGNGIIVLGPRAQLMVGRTTKLNKRHFRLIRGRVHFQTKGGVWRNRPPGAFFSIKDKNIAYIGKKFTINYTKSDRALIVKDRHVSVFSLGKRNEAGGMDDADEEDEEEELEDEVDYLALIEEQSSGTGEVDVVALEEQSPINFKAIFRGVHVQENQFINTDTKTTIDGETDSVNGSSRFQPKDNYFDVRLEWDTQHKSGGGYLFTRGWLEYGTQNNVYKDPLEFLNFRKEGRNNIEISEFFYQYSWDAVDLTLGKKVIRAGFGNLFSIADRITPRDLYDPLDTRFLGNFTAGVDYYPSGSTTLSYHLLPYYLPDKAPQRLVSDVDGDLTTPSRDYPVSEISNFRHYLQVKGTYSGWDLFLGYLYGPFTRPVYKQITSRNSDGSPVDCDTSDCQIIEEYARVHRLQSGFSTNLSIFNIYSEAVYQHAESRKDDNFFSYVVGTRFKIDNFIVNRTEIIAEYTKEKVTEKQKTEDIDTVVNNIQPGETRTTYLESSRESNFQRNDILARLTMELSDRVKLSFNTTYDLEDSSRLYMGEFYWTPKDNWSVQFNIESYILELESDTETSTRSTPFGEVDVSESTSLTRTYNRFTLKLGYTF